MMPDKTEAEKDTARLDWLTKKIESDASVELWALEGKACCECLGSSGAHAFYADTTRQAIDAAMEADAHKGE